MRAVCDPHLMLPLSGQGCRICVASISAVIPGAAHHEVVRCRPGTQVPRHQKKGTAGVLGSRLSLRSAGMTTEETAPYAIALPFKGRKSLRRAVFPMTRRACPLLIPSPERGREAVGVAGLRVR